MNRRTVAVERRRMMKRGWTVVLAVVCVLALGASEAQVQLFEQTEDELVVRAPRVCEVEVRGDNKVRVRALGYPLVGLFEKMSEATGVKIEFPPLSKGLRDRMEKAMGEKIRVEPEVSGLVDYVHTDWRSIPGSLSLIDGPQGLSSPGLSGPGMTEGAVRISIVEGLYMASLAERAAKLPPPQKQTHPETGIERGYVIFGGRYVSPPYKVEFRETEERGALYINDLQLPTTYRLKYEHISELSAPPEADSREEIGDLGTYVGRLFATIKEQQGHEQATKAVTDLLRQYPYVKSFEFKGSGGTLLEMIFTDGMSYGVLLNTYKAPRKLSAREHRQNAEKYRKRKLATADKLKTRIETRLRGDGLVLIYTTYGFVQTMAAEEADKRLRAVCVALYETARHKEEIRRALFELPTPESSDCAWEIFLNLRHRELWQRLRKENIE